jgi:hypothetical protein
MPRPQLAAFLIASALLAAPEVARSADPAAAPAPEPADEARACAERNLPHQTLELRATFTKVDRVGGERVSRAKVLGKKLEDGLRRVVLRFDKPLDVRGTAMLMIESANGPSDFYVYSPDERRTRRVASRGSGGLFGTDFSYDDFENWRGFSRRGQVERLPDAEEAGRPVYVLATTPAPEDGSTYERVTSYVDKQSCVVLRIDSFEQNARLRKVLRADPKSVKSFGAMAFATDVVLEDVLDQTSTRVKLDDVKLDVDIPDGRFRPTDLGS